MRRLQNWVIFALISIIIIAMILRLIKLYEFAIWGSDSGEHYFLLNQMIDTGQINHDYNGWGFAYPYFPGMHILLSGFTQLTNLTPFHVLIFLIPATSGLSVLLIFCISYRIFRDPRVGLVSAGFLAVVLAHVYSTSHPMPGSLGGLFLLACILLLLKTYDNKKFMIPLILITFALILTHHMSTYFLIISIITMILLREFLQYPYDPNDENYQFKNRTLIDIGYLILLITLTLPFWLYYAEPFQSRILSKGFPLPTWLLIPLAYFFIILLWIIIHYRRKNGWRYKPKIRTVKQLVFRIGLFQVFAIIILYISTITNVSGTNMETNIIAVPLFLPQIVLISFIPAASTIMKYYRDGITIYAWFIAILLSIFFAFITRSQELLVYRHFPYIFEPISIFVGLGIVKFFDMYINNQDTTYVYLERNIELLKIDPKLKISNKQLTMASNRTTKGFAKQNYIANFSIAGVVTFLIILCGIFSYPPLDVVSGFEEGTTQDEFDSCFWIREHLPNGSTVASDHRMSSMVFGFSGLNSSWEYAPNTLHGEAFDEFDDELNQIHTPSGKKKVNYILITDAIKRGVALKQWENAMPMSDSAINKFNDEPFIKLYDNGDVQIYRYQDN